MATGTDFWVRLAGYPLWLASPHAYTVSLFRDYRLDPSPADRALARLPDGRYLLHRVVGKDDAFYYTRGTTAAARRPSPGSRWWGWRWKSPGGAGGFPWPGKYTVCIHGSGWPGTRCGGLREGSGWGWAAECGGNAHEEKIYQ